MHRLDRHLGGVPPVGAGDARTTGPRPAQRTPGSRPAVPGPGRGRARHRAVRRRPARGQDRRARASSRPSPKAPLRWPTASPPGRSARVADRYRRGLYTYLKRTAPYAASITMDAPTSEATCVRRDRSNTPLQALTLLNDAVFVEAAQAMARRIVVECPDRSADARARPCLPALPDPLAPARGAGAARRLSTNISSPGSARASSTRRGSPGWASRTRRPPCSPRRRRPVRTPPSWPRGRPSRGCC